MGNVRLFRDIPLVARWLFGIGVVLGTGVIFLNAWAILWHLTSLLAIWVDVAQIVVNLLWAIAFIMTAIVLQHRNPQSSLSTQPWLWFGLLFLVSLPNFIIRILQDNHVLLEEPVENAILLISLISGLLCLALGVYFWRRKRRMVTY